MTAAEALRTACAIAQVPGYSPSCTAKGMLALWGKSLSDVPCLNDAILQQSFGWNASQIESFHAKCDEPIHRYQRHVDRGIHVSTLLDEEPGDWQDHLTNVPIMFCRGDLAILKQPSIGFSGSRDATEQALEVTRKVAMAAAESGMTVISGGARGVDMAAHSAALTIGGTTIVLIPQGIDGWWTLPAFLDHMDRVLVVSFDLPWAEWTTPSAMQRNRAIVDLSKVMAIPQAGTSGGSHKTGLYALSRDRNLWVADFGIDYPGNQLLIQRGARPLPWNEGSPDLELMRQAPARKPIQQSLF